MLCDVLLTFIIVFSDGHKENRIKWITRDVAEEFIKTNKDPEFLKMLQNNGVDHAENFNIKSVPPYDCARGPK